MAYTIKPDGSIVVDTVEEALELQRRIHAQAQAQPQLPLRHPPQLSATNPSSGAVRANGNQSYVHEIFEKLKAYDGQEIGSETMRDVLETKTIDGVGSRLYHMKSRGVPLDDVLHERKDDRGIKTWVVRFK